MKALIAVVVVCFSASFLSLCSAEEKFGICSTKPCQNNGTCADTRPGGFQCTCSEGYGGQHCENVLFGCLSDPCQNGAGCIDSRRRVRGPDFKCFCTAGWAGKTCNLKESEVIYDQVFGCSSNPCVNGGQCVDSRDGVRGPDFKCYCPPEWTGKTCETKKHSTEKKLTRERKALSSPPKSTSTKATPLELIDDVCQRPSSGPCSTAGSCCGEVNGTQRFIQPRHCHDGHCHDDDDDLIGIRPCRIRCSEIDSGAYGPWVPSGGCNRPTEGKCSDDNTCCGQLVGLMDHTRECTAPYGCNPVVLNRQLRCSVRCDHVHQCNRRHNTCSNGGTCTYKDNRAACICPIGWKGRLCENPDTFLISPTTQTYEGAKSFCEAHDRVLVEFTDEAEYSEVVNWTLAEYNIPKNRGEAFWTGMIAVDKNGESMAYLSNGGRPAYTKWGSGAILPISSQPQHVHLMLKTRTSSESFGLWNKFGENTMRPALCGKLTRQAPLLISRHPYNFDDAKYYCESVGRKLVEFQSEEQYSNVVDWMLSNYNQPKNRGESFWTGMFAADTNDNTLAYLTNGQPGYTKWARGSLLPISTHPTRVHLLLKTRLRKKNFGIWNKFDSNARRQALCGNIINSD